MLAPEVVTRSVPSGGELLLDHVLGRRCRPVGRSPAATARRKPLHPVPPHEHVLERAVQAQCPRWRLPVTFGGGIADHVGSRRAGRRPRPRRGSRPPRAPATATRPLRAYEDPSAGRRPRTAGFHRKASVRRRARDQVRPRHEGSPAENQQRAGAVGVQLSVAVDDPALRRCNRPTPSRRCRRRTSRPVDAVSARTKFAFTSAWCTPRPPVAWN